MPANAPVWKDLTGWGPEIRVAHASFVPSGSTNQTLEENEGISAITRSGAGAYQAVLANKSVWMMAIVEYEENDTTHLHVVRVESKSTANGTVDFSHKSAVWASVSGGLTANDTVDRIHVTVLQRIAP